MYCYVIIVKDADGFELGAPFTGFKTKEAAERVAARQRAFYEAGGKDWTVEVRALYMWD